ncbi:G-type lectin S-receptor-like serine/threonine-protein kinase RKS1 [Vitis vinifera]|uniref:non-specific serine/threonine protein kinase n=1 Tax=Vitis vinifera TaxID=29760 RepID=A0A438DP76_VITVI|nr:G-type lectin S-receptor-like serine/threonine-protein kinase RKS1 [Vitis vinifera]
MLDWPKRFLIINGIAQGLLYLNQDSRLRIIHRDVKAENILLDIEMSPKISDFGIARSLGGNEMKQAQQECWNIVNVSRVASEGCIPQNPMFLALVFWSRDDKWEEKQRI